MRDGQLGRRIVLKHCIDLQNDEASPIYSATYRSGSTAKQFTVDNIIPMIAKNVIERAATEWAAPIIFVRKKDGQLCFGIAYQKPGVVTIRDAYHLLHMDK